MAEQIMLISQQGNDTLGTAFIVGLLIALITANSGMSALFDALNVVYDEREKRSDLPPNLPSFIRRVCSGYAPDRGVLRTQSV